MKHLFYILCFYVAATCNGAFADSMVHKFKSPSFNGVGYSAHALTIENQEFSRQKATKEKKEAAAKKLNEVITNDRMLNQMGLASRKLAKLFDINTNYRKFEKVIDRAYYS